MSISERPLVSIQVAAKTYNVHKDTIRRRIAAGQELEQLLSRRQHSADCCECSGALIISVSHPLANVAVSDCAIGVRDDAELLLDASAVNLGVGAAHRTRIRRFGWAAPR